MGLSPPVRGNRLPAGSQACSEGSIPARAGEPQNRHPSSVGTRVYPRPCGGTACQARKWPSMQGLSPPVRGNPEHEALDPVGRGSIPARAGEPGSRPRRVPPPGVYPRPCGGTFALCVYTDVVGGLSPPVRGNLKAEIAEEAKGRSIPARAGEPLEHNVLKYIIKDLERPFGHHLRFTSKTPSASTISLGAAPRHLIWRLPTASRSRHTKTTEPFRREFHQSETTFHIRVLTAADMSGAT